MKLPFTIEQFLSVFERYNRAIGPAPLFGYALALLALGLAWHGGQRASRAVLAILAAFWVFTGAGYHLTFFRAVNPLAPAFGMLFILQGALYLVAAARPRSLSFHARPTPREALALCFALYAMVLYPLLGIEAGRGYPRAPLLGVAPCPTTIFTFAILLLARDVVPPSMFVIPFLWSILGVSAAADLGILEDYGLAVAGVVGTAIFVADLRRSSGAPRHTEPDGADEDLPHEDDAPAAPLRARHGTARGA